MFKLIKKYQQRNPAIVIGVVLAIVFILMQIFNHSPQDIISKEKQPDYIDYYIKHFHNRIFKNDGTLQYILSGKELKHYENGDRVTINLPTLIYQDKEEWRIASDFAVATEDMQQEIIFQDNAVIEQNSDENFSVTADIFSFFPDKKIFTADQQSNPITIRWGDGLIQGNHIVANIDKEKFTLENVNAVYSTQ